MGLAKTAPGAVLAGICALIFPMQELRASGEAIVVETAEIVFDGKPAGKIAAGTRVKILGQKKEQGLTLIRFGPKGGKQSMGLVRTSALVESAENAPQTSTSPGDENRGQTPEPTLDLDKTLTATELAEYLEKNRDDFNGFQGKPVKVEGVVESLKVAGQVGSMVTAEITLKTRTDLPRVRLLVHASEFMEDSKGDRFEMRVQGRTLEGRSRDKRYPYRYWYWYDGYWRWRNAAKSEWVPIISVGEPIKGTGVLGKYHIHVDLEGAKIDKG